MQAETDLFEILEMSPGPPEPDEAALKAQLAKKKQEWARSLSQGAQKSKREAQRKLDLLPVVQEIIADPRQRREAAARARLRLEAAAREVFSELDDMIALLRKDSLYCDQAHLENLVRRFEKIGRPEIERRLRAAGISLERKPRKSADRVEPIDAQLAREIKVQLEHLGKKNLYDFLELPPQSSARALKDQAKEIYRENQRLGRSDARSSAANKLAGTCADRIFVDETTKKRYDAYLATAAMESLKPQLDLAGTDRRFSENEVNHFLEEARRRGVGADDALAFIERYAEERGWQVQSAAEHPAEALQQCGFCTALAPAQATRCSTCGQSLAAECPQCQKTNPTTAAVCFHCGCSVGDAMVVQGLLKEGKRLLVEKRYEEALGHFERGLLYWTGWAPLLQAKREAEAGKEAQNRQVAELELLVGDGRLNAAEQMCGRLKREGVPGLEAVGGRIAESLAKARQLFEQGLRARQAGDRKAADTLFDQALAHCSDLPPLLSLLAENPPASPSSLRVEPLPQGFRLSWTGSEAGVLYRVVRKAGGQPRDDRDGQRLGDVAICALDDVPAPLGADLYYAVFALRRGTLSRSAAGSGPHQRVGVIEPVQNLKWQKVGGALLLTWDWPGEVDSARIAYGYDNYPERADSPGPRVDLTLAEYRQQKGFVLQRPEPRRHFFAVFARAENGTYSPPAKVFAGLGQETVVSYRLAIKRSLLRRIITEAALELRSESRELVLPALLVVAKPRVVPITPQDGRVVLQIPELRLERGLARINIPASEWQTGMYFKVFFADAAAGEGTRLLPGAKEELMLS